MRGIRKKIIIILWGGVLLFIFGIIAGFFAISRGVIGYMPDLKDLQNPVSKYSSHVYDYNGNLIGDWSLSTSNRSYTSYDELSPYLIEALVATEDERFMDHSGVDFKALFRAVFKRGMLNQKSAGGGSTITQQLAKQLYTYGPQGGLAKTTLQRLMQKPVEWVIAIELERMYTKEEIISMYLNQYDFLYNANGIKLAAKTYFNKKPSELSLCESATLIGMLKNATLYKPVTRDADGKNVVNNASVERRNVVLGQMKKADFISDELYRAAINEPLDVSHFNPTLENSQKEGKMLYLREYLRKIMMAEKPVRSKYADWQYPQYYNDSLSWVEDPLYGWCKKNRKRDGSEYNLYTDGLKVYTTIDPQMQEYAERAVHEHLDEVLQPKFDAELKSPLKPYSSDLDASVVSLLKKRAMQQSARWVSMKKEGYTDADIIKSFDVPRKMTVYSSYTKSHSIDTTFTPMDSMLWSKHFLRSGFMCMEANTGFVKCYVGGLDFNFFQYDMVMIGRRQVGSTMKPLLYSEYMQNGYTPCDYVSSKPERFDGGNGQAWTPRGGANAGGGRLTVKRALQKSNNTCSAHIIKAVTPSEFLNWLKDLGVKYVDRAKYNNDILCLGPCDISVSEMCSAYTAFACKGVRHAPVLVTRITDADGNVLADVGNGLQPYVKEVMSDETSYKMIDMMQAVVQHGTGIQLRHFYRGDAAGKTGTTNDNSDGWFMCFTPELVMGTWVGGEERYIHFNNDYEGQGAHLALPICGRFLSYVYADEKLGYNKDKKFDIPEGYDPCAERDPLQVSTKSHSSQVPSSSSPSGSSSESTLPSSEEQTPTSTSNENVDEGVKDLL